jgi:hypothetical protein
MELNLKDAVYVWPDGATTTGRQTQVRLDRWAASSEGQAFMDRAELHQETRRQYRLRERRS